MSWLLAIAVASAADPVVDVTPPDTVVGVFDVRAAPDAVRAHLEDPAWVANVDGGKTKVTVVSREGRCMVADFVSPSPLITVEYRVRRCALDDGYEAKMLTSNAFKAYRVRWEVAPDAEGEGSRVTYTIQLTTSLWGVPNSLVTSSTRKSVQRMLGRVQTALDAG